MSRLHSVSEYPLPYILPLSYTISITLSFVYSPSLIHTPNHKSTPSLISLSHVCISSHGFFGDGDCNSERDMNESSRTRGDDEQLIPASLVIPSLALRNSEVEFPLEARTPLFQAELAINEGRIILEPSLDEVQGAFLQAVDKMVAAFRSVLSVDKGTKMILTHYLTHLPSFPRIHTIRSPLLLTYPPPPPLALSLPRIPHFTLTLSHHIFIHSQRQ